MKPCLYTRADLARDLRALRDARPNDEASLRAFYKDAQKVHDALHDPEATQVILPAEDLRFIRRFLLDAKADEARLERLIAALEG